VQEKKQKEMGDSRMKRNARKLVALLLAAQMMIATGLTSFAQNSSVEAAASAIVAEQIIDTETDGTELLLEKEKAAVTTVAEQIIDTETDGTELLLEEEEARAIALMEESEEAIPDGTESFIPQAKMTASASHSGSSDPASQAIDGNTAATDGNGKTVWASWGRGDDTAKDPQWIQLDFDRAYSVKALEMTGRSNMSRGFVTLYDLEIRADGGEFVTVTTDGTFDVPANGVAVRAELPEITEIVAIRLTAKDCMLDRSNFWPAISNLNVVVVGEPVEPEEPEEIPDGPESLVPQDKMTASATHSGKGDEVDKAIDGAAMTAQNGRTVWASWGRTDDTIKAPQSITLKLDRAYAVKALKMTGRSNSNEGFVTKYDLEISVDGNEFTMVAEDGNFTAPATHGTAVRADLPKITKVTAIRFTAKDCEPSKNGVGKFWPAISNLDVVVVGEAVDPEEPVVPGDPDKIWASPEIAPTPAEVTGVENPVILLNDWQGSGDWEFLFTPPSSKPASGDFDVSTWDGQNWKNIIVPGEILMQGYDIAADKEYYYKTTLTIPADYDGNRILVRFQGVYSDARVWVNGKFVRNHVGGFTTWDCDITTLVGEMNGEAKEVTMVVGVTDVRANPSYGSTYAHHNMGGILRDVELLALPNDYIKSIHVETELDETFTDAELKLDVKLGMVSENATVEFELIDKSGNTVALEPGNVAFTKDAPRAKVSIPVTAPELWDAEHPNLYELKATLKVDGEIKQANTQKIGFREVTYQVENETYDRNKVYVNGKDVKLRGTCRHDISYDLGRTMTDEQTRQELQAYKDMNINFLRTSHYPPNRRFMEICDEIGLYVEVETAVCFQYGYNALGTPSFLNQYTEMIEWHRNNVSVLMWSLGNESYHYGNPEVYHKKWDYIKATDTTRPAIFSWPSSVRDGSVPYDIYSAHYVNWDLTGGGAGYGNPDYDNFPVIHDEYAHIACYNVSELQNDTNVRNFWGESLKGFWDNLLEKDGALGGALWGGIDDVFYIPEGTTERYQKHSDGDAAGYGEWGSVLDVFLRLKPEAWLTKKAYSPIRIDEENIAAPAANEVLALNAKNWFDHTDFDEVTLVYQINDGEAQTTTLSSVAPHTAGTIEVPANDWKTGDKVNLKFYADYDNILIDEYNIVLGGVQVDFEPASETAPTVTEDGDVVTVSGKDFAVKFSKQKAQITEGSFNGEVLLKGGPQLNALGGIMAADATTPLTYKVENNQAIVTLLGSYGATKVQFDIEISGNGIITTNYTLLTAPPQKDGCSEVGVVYEIASGMESVSWLRDGFWSAYPEDHIGRNEGTALRIRPGSDVTPDEYGVKPNWGWEQDMRNFFLYPKNSDKDGIMTNDFKAMRENVWTYDVNYGEEKSGIRVESADASVAARISIGKGNNENFVDDRDPRIVYSAGGWSTYEAGTDYAGTETFSTKLGATAEFAFNGIGVRYIGSKQNNVGKVKIYIDGNTEVDTFSDIGNALKQTPIYSIDNLKNGPHTIKLEASGGKYNCIVVDAFEVLTEKSPEIKETTKLIINNQWYYPGLDWGNYEGISGKLNQGSTGSATIRLTSDTGEEPSTADKTQLELAINLADGILTDERYDKMSKAKLAELVSAAKALRESGTATQAQVDEMSKALTRAAVQIRLMKIINDGQRLLNEIDQTKYSVATVKALKDAVAHAENLLALGTTDQKTLDQAEANMNKVLSAFNPAPSKPSKGGTSKASDSDYWGSNSIVEKISNFARGETLSAKLEAGAMMLAKVLDTAKAKGVNLNIEINGKDYLILMTNIKLDEAAIYYTAEELIAMASTPTSSNPETGGEVPETAPAVPAAVIPATPVVPEVPEPVAPTEQTIYALPELGSIPQ